MTLDKHSVTLVSVFSFLVLAAGCGDPAEEAAAVAESCGDQTCPAGTVPSETRSLSASNDISAGFNPATYAADGAYKKYGAGSCEYACVVQQPCPADTFPVITRTCFTCGAVTANGIEQGACTDEGKVAIECGEQPCPYGTGYEEKRNITTGYDVSQGYDPDAYDPENAYAAFGSGACEYACKVLYPCGEGMFPVLTPTCLTCAAIVDGEVVQGDCSGTGAGGSDGAGGAGE